MTNDEMINNLHEMSNYLIARCIDNKVGIPFIEEFKDFPLPKKFYILQPICSAFGNIQEGKICSGFFRFLLGISNEHSIEYAKDIDEEVADYLTRIQTALERANKLKS